MQATLSYRTNRDLFSNHYLDEHLPETEAWDQVSDEDLQNAHERIIELWEAVKDDVRSFETNESQLEDNFIRPMFRELGIPYVVEESTHRTQRRPDYGFFESEDAISNAYERREEGGDFYENAVAVADAKRWGRTLDTRGSGEHERDFENPSYQIHVYLQETPVRWAVLTNGEKWRLYYSPTSHRLDSYYEVDLPTILEQADLEDFKYFYLFFRQAAYLEDASGDSFLDDVYSESNIFAHELGEDLQDNIYEAIKVLSEGFLQYPDNGLGEEDLQEIHDSSLIYLYRLIFILYAEAEGRELLNTANEIYEQSYSLNSLKQKVAEELDSSNPKYRDWQDNLWSRLDELFRLIDQGSKSRGIPEEDLYIPAYNGGLFRTNPDEGDSPEAQFLNTYKVGDAYLATVIELLTRSQNGNAGGKVFVDYSSLDVRHLGSIYEGLLEYKLNVADEPLSLDDGEFVSADEGDEIVVSVGEVYLTTDRGERKATGSYYTPEYVVEYIVENSLGPLVKEIREDLAGQSAFYEGGFASEFAEKVFELKILDPAMGSGHFLTNAVDFLAREIIDAQEKQAAQEGIDTVEVGHDINWARRQVAQRCIYGVDINPLAVELSKVSLWLRTLAAEQPLAFLDHHLKTGNSLIGSNIEEIEELESESGSRADGNATLADFGVARKGTVEQLMRIYEDFVAIENQDLADVKEMEAKYGEFEHNKLRQRLNDMASIHTAEGFDVVNLPSRVYEQMAEALEDDNEWEDIEQVAWFQTGKNWAERERNFHWRLEYPEVFYDQDGSERKESGFDAVIGNPPYGKQISDTKKEYYNNKFSHQEYQLDRYLLFIEQCIQLTKNSGNVGLIIPNTWLTNLKFGKIRELIFESTSIKSIVEYRNDVFPEVTVEPITLVLSNEQPDSNTIVIRSNQYERTTSNFVLDQHFFQDEYDSSINIFSSAAALSIGDKFTDNPKLREVCDIYNGTKPFEKGKGNPPQTREIVDDKPYVSEEKEDESFEPLLRGSLIERYLIKWSGNSWISYGEWLAAPRDPEIFYVDSKIVIRQTGDSLIAALDENQFIARDNLHIIIPKQEQDIRYFLGIINSKFANWYYQEIINPEKGEALAQVKKGHVGRLPMPEITLKLEENEVEFSLDHLWPENVDQCGTVLDYADNGWDDTQQMYDLIVILVECIRLLKRSRGKLNLNLLDYLGTFKDGPQLSDLNLIPSEEVSTTILNETTESRNKLQIGDIKINRVGEEISISVSARYKPDDSNEQETDKWGYLDTEHIEAFTMINFSKTEADLIEVFLPLAVEEGGGFANFRENATKNISLLDRLKGIQIPDPIDVSEDLKQYLKIKEQATNLSRQIRWCENRVDRIVYDLYDLTEEEIDSIESSVDE